MSSVRLSLTKPTIELLNTSLNMVGYVRYRNRVIHQLSRPRITKEPKLDWSKEGF